MLVGPVAAVCFQSDLPQSAIGQTRLESSYETTYRRRPILPKGLATFIRRVVKLNVIA